MLFYLTNTVLDIIWGSTFWILKKTTSGVYYLVWGDDTPRLENGEYDAIIITKEDIENDEKEMNKIYRAIGKNTYLTSEIKHDIALLK